MVACACGGLLLCLSPWRENGAGVRLRAWWVMIVAESFNGYKGHKAMSETRFHGARVTENTDTVNTAINDVDSSVIRYRGNGG